MALLCRSRPVLGHSNSCKPMDNRLTGIGARTGGFFVLLSCASLVVHTAVGGDTTLRFRAAGLRTIEGRHLILVTDLPENPNVDALPGWLDQALPQWCSHLEIATERAANWHVTAYLMQDKGRFESLDLLPNELPPFDHGYFLDRRIWMFEQPSDYYRRHLLLHEAVHALMNNLLGGCGPPWYMEGIAELLATHKIADGKLLVGYFPRDREEVPYWGRIKIVRDDVDSGHSRSVDEVLALLPGRDRTNTGYGWCWALAAFLDGHPRFHQRFRALAPQANQDRFDDRFRAAYSSDWSKLNLEWRLFIEELDYGYDLTRAALEWTSRKTPSNDAPDAAMIDAGRGWQSAGFRLEAGVAYVLRASGRYELHPGPPPWICEPQGISIHYYRNRPLGELLAAILPDDDTAAAPERSFLRPVVVGREIRIRPSVSGIVYLKINESPAKLSDNRGQLTVEISRQQRPRSQHELD